MIDAMVGRTVSPEFIGRTEQLFRAEAILDAAGAAPTHLLIAGEAGVGKTRFTRELERLAVARGVRVLRGGCVSIGGMGLPYAPFAAALRDRLRDIDPALRAAISDREAAALGHLVPGLATDDPAVGDGPTGVEASASRAQLFEALLAVLRQLSGEVPLLLIVEDVHWADPATRDALTFLVPNLAADRVHLALTFRSDELDRRDPIQPWLAELGRNSSFERIDLERFSRDETADLVATIVGESPGPAELDRLQERSDGNAFFVEELLLAGGGGISVAGLPPTVRATLIARIEAAPEVAHRVLRVAAVAGRRVDHELLAATAGLAEADLTVGLRAAIDRQLLVQEGDRNPGYAFRHALVQEVVYDDLLPSERRSLHRAYAEALATRTQSGAANAAVHWAELAHHWGAARDDVRAAAASIRAGESAAATFAFVAAQRHFETALELWDSVPDPSTTLGLGRIDLLVHAAGAAEVGGNYHRMADLIREAIAMVDSAADPVRSALLHESLGRALWLDGDTDASLANYGEAVRLMPDDRPTPERARVLAGMGQILMLVDRALASIASCEEAATVARAVGERRIESHALNSMGVSLAMLGRCGEGVAALEAALAIGLELRSADDVARSYVNLTDAMRLCALDRAAHEVVASGIAAIDEMGMLRSYGPIIRQGGALNAFGTGDWQLAERLAGEARRIDRPGRNFEIYGLTYTVGLAVARADPDVADRLERFTELMADRREIEGQYAGQYALAAAEHALWNGRPADAIVAVDIGLRWLEPKAFHHYTCLIHAVAARAEADVAENARAGRRPDGAVADAIARIDAHIAAIDAALVAHAPEPGGRAELECARRAAIAERARAAGSSDPTLWRAAADAWDERGRPYEAAQARWREAEAWLARGDRAAARGLLVDAWQWATAHGARPFLTEIEGLARRSRIELAAADSSQAGSAMIASQPAEAVPPDGFGLTRREREVLGLVVEGQTNRQIADRLFITENTAGVHVSNILGKLGAASRTEAAAIAHRLGLVASPGGSVG